MGYESGDTPVERLTPPPGRRLDTTTFREPTITRRDDGSLTLDWADGLLATSIRREVIEGLVDGHNATLTLLRRLVEDRPLVHQYDTNEECWVDTCGYCGQDATLDQDHAPDCPWVAARRALGMEP